MAISGDICGDSRWPLWISRENTGNTHLPLPVPPDTVRNPFLIRVIPEYRPYRPIPSLRIVILRVSSGYKLVFADIGAPQVNGRIAGGSGHWDMCARHHLILKNNKCNLVIFGGIDNKNRKLMETKRNPEFCSRASIIRYGYLGRLSLCYVPQLRTSLTQSKTPELVNKAL